MWDVTLAENPIVAGERNEKKHTGSMNNSDISRNSKKFYCRKIRWRN
jgi:hypothetical protein